MNSRPSFLKKSGWKFRINFGENVQKSRKLLPLKYLDGINQKTSNKVNALSRVTPLMSFPKKRIFMNSFLKLESNYCPLLRMFHIRSINSKINHLHKRWLRILYNRQDFIIQGTSVPDPIHKTNFEVPKTAIFKVYNNIVPSIFNEIFDKRNL